MSVALCDDVVTDGTARNSLRFPPYRSNFSARATSPNAGLGGVEFGAGVAGASERSGRPEGPSRPAAPQAPYVHRVHQPVRGVPRTGTPSSRRSTKVDGPRVARSSLPFCVPRSSLSPDRGVQQWPLPPRPAQRRLGRLIKRGRRPGRRAPVRLATPARRRSAVLADRPRAGCDGPAAAHATPIAHLAPAPATSLAPGWIIPLLPGWTLRLSVAGRRVVGL